MEKIIAGILLLCALFAYAESNEQDLYIKALNLAQDEQCEQAFNIVKGLIEKNPSNSQYYDILVSCQEFVKQNNEKYLAGIIESHPQATGAYYALGRYYLGIENYLNAVINLRKALELNPAELNYIFYLAEAFSKAKQEAEGADYFKSSTLAEILKETGMAALEMQKDFSKGIAALEKVFNAHPAVWILADRLRDFYFNNDENEQALQWAFKELPIAEKSNDNERIAESYANVAAHSLMAGNNLQAEEYALKAAKKYGELKDAFYEAEWYRDLCIINKKTGKIHQALAYLLQAEKIATDYSLFLQSCAIQKDIGSLYLDAFKEPDKALPYFFKALKTCKNEFLNTFQLAAISNAYAELADFKQAHFYLRKAKELLTNVTPSEKETFDQHECRLYMMAKKWNKAREVCGVLLSGKKRSLASQSYNNLLNAEIFYQLGQFKQAEELARTGIKGSDEAGNFNNQWRARLILANSLLTQNQIDNAIATYEETGKLLENLRGEIASPSYQTRYFQSKDDVYNWHLKALWAKYQETLKSQTANEDKKRIIIEQAFVVTQKAKSRALIDMLRNQEEAGNIEESPELQNAANDISVLQSRLRNMKNKASENEIAQLETKLNEAYAKYQLLHETTSSYRKESFARVHDVTLSDVQKNLLSTAALLEYKIMDDAGFCMLITGKNVQWFQIDGTKTYLDSLQKFLAYITTPQRSTMGAFYQKSHDLYARLLKKPLAGLEGIDHLIIVPDGILHNIPFEALRINLPSSVESAQYVIHRYSVSYAPSSYAYMILQNKSENNDAVRVAKNTILAVGNAAYDGNYLEKVRSSFDLTAPLGKLKYTEKEILGITQQKAYSSRKLLGIDVTEEHVKQAMDNTANYLHFAVHGLLNAKDPGLSGLLFIPGSDNEDGIFQAYEIEKMNIDADLVFLSACNSSAGKIYAGEGITGISTAFIAAGAKRVIGTMWAINDYSTAYLVESFYANLAKSDKNYAASLRSAQLSLMKLPQYSHPYYWASFRLTGAL